MAEYYRKGIMSLQEAASQEKVNLYEMMDYFQKEKILPPAQSTNEILEDLKHSTTLFKDIKNSEIKAKK